MGVIKPKLKCLCVPLFLLARKLQLPWQDFMTEAPMMPSSTLSKFQVLNYQNLKCSCVVQTRNKKKKLYTLKLIFWKLLFDFTD